MREEIMMKLKSMVIHGLFCLPWFLHGFFYAKKYLNIIFLGCVNNNEYPL
jgi:hypothetical protein